MIFGKGTLPTYRLKLVGKEIDWVQKWKYRGVTLCQGQRFGCCVAETMRKFTALQTASYVVTLTLPFDVAKYVCKGVFL